MPFRAIASYASSQITAIASSVGMGIYAGLCYILGTVAPEATATLNASTKIEGSPYALGAIIMAVAGATWFVARLVTQILDKLDSIVERVEALEERDNDNYRGKRK